jgi:hypothetical protein
MPTCSAPHDVVTCDAGQTVVSVNHRVIGSDRRNPVVVGASPFCEDSFPQLSHNLKTLASALIGGGDRKEQWTNPTRC